MRAYATNIMAAKLSSLREAEEILCHRIGTNHGEGSVVASACAVASKSPLQIEFSDTSFQNRMLESLVPTGGENREYS